MRSHAVLDLETNIARGRIVLSAVTLLSVFIDPTTTHLGAWIHVSCGPSAIDAHLVQILGVHLAFAGGS